jgi:hypothetical protein
MKEPMRNSESSPDSPDLAHVDTTQGGRPKSESDTDEHTHTTEVETNAGEPKPKGPPEIPKLQ